MKVEWSPDPRTICRRFRVVFLMQALGAIYERENATGQEQQ